MEVGDTFHGGGHLWIAVAKAKPSGDIVAFNITTYRPGTLGSDGSCVLENGEHPFIKHKSEVYYAGGLLLSVQQQGQ